MWSRQELKTRAKEVLKGSYWKAFLVSILILFTSGGGGGGGNINLPNNSNAPGSMYGYNAANIFDTIPLNLIAVFIAIIFFAILIGIGIRIFLGYPVEVGGRKYFIRAAEGHVSINYLSLVFKKVHYLNVVKTMFLKDLYIFLWFLLFIIPGIVKGYAYSMVPYIMAENPGMDYKRAIEISNNMTYGHKFKMWVLDLSFIGWFLLGSLALFVGTVFVIPYVFSTKAELYLVLKKNALDNGICLNQEFVYEG
ncbi:MAG: hypothetical protein BWY15_00936 [Firmicutes bacterium ADurb.Bin193]|nr:MAG: hypothetical protein BWY15_00936 [Firmicutes bacterium ADurb.Bin193]